MNIFSKSQSRKLKDQHGRHYTEADLFPVLATDELLPDIEKTLYLKKIQDIVALPEEHFQAIYEDLIVNFANFVQILPEKYGEELGGLLNEGLRRGLLAIQILHNTSSTKPHPLFVFAIYSIALLSDIGQVIATQKVMISDENGVFIEEWIPYLGPIPEFGEYYKLRPYSGVNTALVNSVTPLLARQLLSETGITWLASNNNIFDMWLAFLYKGEDWAGGLGKVLRLDKKQFDHLVSQEVGLIPIDMALTEPLGTEAGEKFLAWLREGLEDGTISINQEDSKAHIIKSGEGYGIFLETPELFQQFCNVTIKYRDWVVVYKQFNYLGITKLSGGDYKIQQFFDEPTEGARSKLGFLGRETAVKSITKSRSIREGVVIKDPHLLLSSNKLTVSPYLKEIEMRWMLDNSLPKIPKNAQQKPERSYHPKRD